MPIFDFKCNDCGSLTEEITSTDIRRIECSVCGSAADRIISGQFLIDPRMGLDPCFPTVGDRWAKVRNQRRKLLDAKHRDHG
jgi:putative FmdB family regulatory protein